MAEIKWGIYIRDLKLNEYKDKDYEQALTDLAFAYNETGIKYELKRVT